MKRATIETRVVVPAVPAVTETVVILELSLEQAKVLRNLLCSVAGDFYTTYRNDTHQISYALGTVEPDHSPDRFEGVILARNKEEYILEMYSTRGWNPASVVDGRTFTKETAEEEARRRSKLNGLYYRVVPKV